MSQRIVRAWIRRPLTSRVVPNLSSGRPIHAHLCTHIICPRPLHRLSGSQPPLSPRAETPVGVPRTDRIAYRNQHTASAVAASRVASTAPHESVSATNAAEKRCTFSFYAYVPLAPERTVHLQRQIKRHLGKDMGVLGRIYLSTEGINGQISCPAARTADLAPFFARFEEFCTLTFNEALDHTESFQRLAVNIREQIVRDHVPATKAAIGPAPTALTPEEWHRQLSGEATAETHTLIDMRNNYESSVGYFRHALKPDVTRFADEIRILPELVRGKEREPVYMYCTGGIRCTKAGALLRARGFQDVRMLAGGITAYGRFIQRTGQPSLYVGKNFTFDQRLGEDVTDDVVGTCYQCGASCDRFTNCASSACNTLFLQCPTCATAYHRTCADRRCLDHVRAPTHPSASPPAQEACRWQHRERVDPTIVRTRITHNLAALRVSGEHSDDGTAQ